jgi:hypothetical protein
MIQPNAAGGYDIDNPPTDFTQGFMPESVVDLCFKQEITAIMHSEPEEL